MKHFFNEKVYALYLHALFLLSGISLMVEYMHPVALESKYTLKWLAIGFYV